MINKILSRINAVSTNTLANLKLFMHEAAFLHTPSTEINHHHARHKHMVR